VVHRQILDGSGQPAFDVFCFAYSYADELGAAAAKDRVQAHALRPGESGYLSRVMIQGEHGLEHVLLACALRESTRDLFLDADWGEAAADASPSIAENVWQDVIQAHVRMSLEGEAETLSEAHHPEGRRPYLPPDSEERVIPPDL
jgi:hypothetical protein